MVIHGDDFTALGTRAALDEYEERLKGKFELEIRGRLSDEPDTEKQIRILNRIVRIDAKGVHYEADPRHAEQVIESMGLAAANSVVTPGVKDDPDVAQQELRELHDDAELGLLKVWVFPHLSCCWLR